MCLETGNDFIGISSAVFTEKLQFRFVKMVLDCNDEVLTPSAPGVV